MVCTIKLDGMGCLHMWEGDVNPCGRGLTWKAAGEWADVFIQSEEDVQHVLENLTQEEREHLDAGYSVTTKNIPSDYFINE